MTDTQKNHLEYTLNEWSKNEYFINVVKTLSYNKIKTYVDIGANVGGVCDILLTQVESLEEAHLIEPQKDNFKFLSERYALQSKVKLYNIGIFYGKILNKVYRCDTNVGGYTLIAQNENFVEQSDIFSCDTLEIFNFKNIDFMKIDVEGSEYNIIKNSSTVKKSKFLEIEFHNGLIEETLNNYLNNYAVVHINRHDMYRANIFMERKN